VTFACAILAGTVKGGYETMWSPAAADAIARDTAGAT
jgi:hypothetical protein